MTRYFCSLCGATVRSKATHEAEAYEFCYLTPRGDPQEREAAHYAAMQAYRLHGDVVWQRLGVSALWAEYLENEEALEGGPGVFSIEQKRSIQEEVAHAIEARVGLLPDAERLRKVMTPGLDRPADKYVCDTCGAWAGTPGVAGCEACGGDTAPPR